jgi:hypothetical protein
MSSCWLPAGIALLLLLSTCVDGRAALPAALAPAAPSAPRSAIIISHVPQAQGPGTPEGFVSLPNTKGVIHLDELSKAFRPAEGPVAFQAAETRAAITSLLEKANAVAALRRAGLIRTNSAMPRFLENRTVEAWNAKAPIYKTPAGDTKPVLAQSTTGPNVKSFTDTNTMGQGGYIAGSVIELLFGIRIATPFFGTGFNFCIGELPNFFACTSLSSACKFPLCLFITRKGENARTQAPARLVGITPLWGKGRLDPPNLHISAIAACTDMHSVFIQIDTLGVSRKLVLLYQTLRTGSSPICGTSLALPWGSHWSCPNLAQEGSPLALGLTLHQMASSSGYPQVRAPSTSVLPSTCLFGRAWLFQTVQYKKYAHYARGRLRRLSYMV